MYQAEVPLRKGRITNSSYVLRNLTLFSPLPSIDVDKMRRAFYTEYTVVTDAYTYFYIKLLFVFIIHFYMLVYERDHSSLHTSVPSP